MDQPLHDVHVRTPNSRRGIALVVVGLLHLGFVYALAVGLAQGLIQRLPEEIKVAVEHPQEQKAPPPPPPPDLAKPPPPVVPPPEIVIQQAAPAAAITTVLHKEAPVQAAAISSPVGIGKPHTCAKYYPDASQRLQETGTVQVTFTITGEGDVQNPKVTESSGKDRLDQAALQCVVTWHYKAAIQNGQPISVQWPARVVFAPAK